MPGSRVKPCPGSTLSEHPSVWSQSHPSTDPTTLTNTLTAAGVENRSRPSDEANVLPWRMFGAMMLVAKLTVDPLEWSIQMPPPCSLATLVATVEESRKM